MNQGYSMCGTFSCTYTHIYTTITLRTKVKLMIRLERLSKYLLCDVCAWVAMMMLNVKAKCRTVILHNDFESPKEAHPHASEKVEETTKTMCRVVSWIGEHYSRKPSSTNREKKTRSVGQNRERESEKEKERLWKISRTNVIFWLIWHLTKRYSFYTHSCVCVIGPLSWRRSVIVNLFLWLSFSSISPWKRQESCKPAN